MSAEVRQPVNPTGLCQCGCGELAPLAPYTNARRGYVRGESLQFRKGHNHRGVRRSPETLARMSAALKGKYTGQANGKWKGGRRINRGRVELLVGADHPMASWDGYCLEYRLIMAEMLGRYLKPNECVHHINLDHTDNTPENLLLCSRSQHMRIHMRLRHHPSDDPVLTALRIMNETA